MQKQKYHYGTACSRNFDLSQIGRILLLACFLLVSGQSQCCAETYGNQGGYNSGPAPLYGNYGNNQPAYGQQPYQNLPPNYGQTPYQYQQQGTVNGTPGYAGTWQDPANGDTVTTIIAPRAPQQQMPQVIGAPGGYYYDGYYDNQQGQYQNQNYGQQGHGGHHDRHDIPGHPGIGNGHPGQHQAGMPPRPQHGGMPGAIGQNPGRPPMPANPGHPGGAGGIRR